MKRPNIRRYIVETFRDLCHIWHQEFRATLRDQGVLIFFVLVPLAYPLIYGFIYTNETLRDVPAAVVDASHSALSREYLRRIEATPEVSIAARCADMEEARQRMGKREAYGIIYIPATFSSDIATGKQTHVSLYCDMSGLLYYKSILLANTNVSLAMNAGIKIRQAGNTTRREDELSAYPIEYEDIALYNPTNGFAAFLLPAVLVLIIQQTLLLGIGLSAGTARENNSFRDLAPVSRHCHGILRIVAGKALSYFTAYTLVAVYVLCIVPRVFRLNQIGDPGTLAMFVLPFLAACIFFAMTMSVAVRNRETCMLLFVFTSVPLLFMSGISWPASAIPAFWHYFSCLFPSTFGINAYVRINSMGASLNEVAAEYRVLWLQAGVYFITACIVCRYQIRLSRRRPHQCLEESPVK